MNYIITIVLSAASLAAGMTPPPYAARSVEASGATAFNSDEKLQPVAGPYVHQYSHGPEGFNIQSGFEGYLVPSASGSHTLLPLRDSLEAISSGAGYLKLLKPLSKFALKLIPKFGILFLGVVVLFLAGGLLTTAICTFTPVCTISFLGLGFTKETMRSYFTQDNLSSTSAFVMDAIKKYRDLYESSSNEIESDKSDIKKK